MYSTPPNTKEAYKSQTSRWHSVPSSAAIAAPRLRFCLDSGGFRGPIAALVPDADFTPARQARPEPVRAERARTPPIPRPPSPSTGFLDATVDANVPPAPPAFRELRPCAFPSMLDSSDAVAYDLEPARTPGEVPVEVSETVVEIFDTAVSEATPRTLLPRTTASSSPLSASTSSRSSSGILSCHARSPPRMVGGIWSSSGDLLARVGRDRTALIAPLPT